MARTALILGARGGFGGAVVAALQTAGWQTRRYARGTDMVAAARGCDLIVNGLNPPAYHDWARQIPAITAQVLASAKASGARVLVPGNVYPFGREPAPWGTATPHRPVSRKGEIRAQMEVQYRAATQTDGLRVLLLRGGDFMAAGSPDLMMNRVVLEKLAKGKVVSMGDPSAMHAWAYLPDMARAAAALLDTDLPDWADVPFAGHAFSVSDLAQMIGRLTGRDMRVTRFPVWMLTLTAPVWELAREVKEMLYLYDHPHWLDPAPLRAMLPAFRSTPLEEVIAAHLTARGISLQKAI